MATVTITRPAKRSTPKPKHPVAYLATDTGIKLNLRFAPRATTLSGSADRWETLDRPGRAPLVRRSGDGLPTLTFDLQLGYADHQASAEYHVYYLRRIAYSGARITLGGMSTQEAGPWRMSDLSIDVTARQQGTNRITRATATITLIAAYDATVVPRGKGPVSGGHKPAKPPTKAATGTRYYVLKRGETLSDVALRFYHDPNRWKPIADASHIRNVRNVPAGARLTIPPRR